MHNQVKLRARNRMALLKIEKANFCDVPHCCSASYSCFGRGEIRKIFKCILWQTVENHGGSRSTAHFSSAFFRNHDDHCLEQRVRMQDSWVLTSASSFLHVTGGRRSNMYFGSLEEDTLLCHISSSLNVGK